MQPGLQRASWYQVLGVASDANADEIKAAFRRAALRLHPDKACTDSSSHSDGPASARAGDEYLLVQQAWQVLQDAGLRAAYDRQLALSAAAADVHINETVQLPDMEVTAVDGEPCYTWPCRCGGAFLLPVEEAEAAAQAGWELTLPCSTCSLHIRVLPEPAGPD
ncbi:hypothetical protein D9Q98_005372 [Chlorella vulgaris]|uniref:Diphthamide biosynthesis protein 4 n=1 Tax=Chlorella vulgaris TaxID=3077 RepID=A0A9D4YVV4_CHLVU|nr:hypothetical protein D9Q98_005372 [Chlorella vulgaris]